MLEVRLLGKFDVRRDGKAIAITSRPAQSLFAYLILHAGTAHRREKLAGMLWPDSLEETARDNLRHALWRVRKALPLNSTVEYLLTDDLSIAFNASAEYWLDAAELEKLSEGASADELIQILSEYQGELLPGFYDEWVLLEREHLYSIFEHHMARLMSSLQEEQRWRDMLDWGERWIKLGQKPEPAYRALMSAHAANGDMSKVAATYERCVKSLKEFGIEPSEQTKELYKNLKSGKETPRVESVSTKSIVKDVSSNIPVPLTSFIGREKELKEIARLLSLSRLLTLTGPGGVGKTRLAIRTASHSIKKFKDGVFWVGLVGLSDENLLPQEIAQSLKVREVSNELVIETLKTNLKSKDLLIVLDNCEHLIKACAYYAEQLLAACPKLKILATSIEALGIFNETIWQVPSLSLPEVQQSLSIKELQEYASIELFNERASNAKSGFVLDARNATTVAQICRRLDGIPLAIELAAARIKVLSVDEIASRLDDRFSLLTAGSRTAIPRHQTLRATIDWSYDLLTEPERILFRRLAVFAGGFTLDAAEAVCSQGMRPSDILDLLGRLVDKSLVIVDEVSKTSETRYRLLETIRQYTLEKLAGIEEAREVRDRHLEFFVKLAEKAEANTFGAESVRYSKRRNQELDNTRAAMDWSIQSRQTIATFRLAAAMSNFWFVGLNDIGFQRSSISEWHGILNKALSSPEGLEHTAERAKALNASGFFYWAGMSPVSPRREIEEALSIGRELGDDAVVAQALCNLGLIESIQGNYVQARSLLQQGLYLFRELGPERKTEYLYLQIVLGDIAMYQDDLPEARMLYEQSSGTLREIHDGNFLAYVVRRLGQLAWHRGEFEKATELCKESLKLDLELGDERAIIACLSAFAGIALARGKVMLAAHLFGAVSTLLEARTIRLLPTDQMEYDRNLASLHAKFNEQTLKKFWEKGKGMSLDQAIAFAREEN
jgi:predicted ATPase/DNA-binding SARP family transcriptional activator